MPDNPTFGRYAEIPYDQMTPEQQEGCRSLVETRRWLRRAEQDLGAQPRACEGDDVSDLTSRTGYSLSEREREIAVVVVNSKWHSIYPTNAHERAGKAAGLSTEKVEALFVWPADLVRRQARADRLSRWPPVLANSRWLCGRNLGPLG